MRVFALRSLRLHFGVAALLAVGLTTPALAQQDSNEPKGIPYDWSHHHLTFSDPGTEQDAVANGTYERWYRITSDPRFQQQQITRGAQQSQASAVAAGDPDHLVLPPQSKTKKLKKDWSMTMGSGAKVGADQYPAVFSAFTQANCDSASQPDFVVYNTGLPGANATAASRTGTFTGDPTDTQMVTIGGTEILTASVSAAATTSATFTGEPATGSTFNLTNPNFSPSHVIALTVSAAGIGDTGSCTVSGNTATAGFSRSTMTSTDAARFVTAINLCGSAFSGVAASRSSSMVTLTGTPAGSAGNNITVINSTTFGTNNWTTSTHLAGGTDGANTGTSFRIDGVLADNATNLALAITRNGGTVGVTAMSAGAVVTVTATATGLTGNNITLQEGLDNFTWAGSTLTGGADNSSIIAYDNLYSSCSGSNPLIYWQYNTITGNTIPTSVVLSGDGKQAAFVQNTSGGVASLVLLKWAKNGTPTTLASTPVGSYRNCVGPCMTVMTFALDAGNAPADTNSAPYYDFANDIMYVGDDLGYLHKFTGVFNGANPAEVGAPWPVFMSAATTANAGKLTGPVYDPTSQLIFVAEGNNGINSGRFHSVNTSGTTVTHSAPVTGGTRLAAGSGFVDAPFVDSSAAREYVFAGNDNFFSGNGSGASSLCGTNVQCVAVWQFPNAVTSTPTEAVVGSTTSALNDVIYDGTFDNTYFNSSDPPTGHMYVCGEDSSRNGEPTLWQVAISSNTMTSGLATRGPALTTAGATCSPVAEFFNTSTSIDWIFLSVTASAVTGSPINCTGGAGCLMNFNVTNASPFGPTKATGATATEAGGTSGIVIDNALSSPAGTSNIYLSPLADQACTGNETIGNGTGGCAIQASQAAP